ncbi:MAG: hypothetical protein OXR68_03235 [Alphaproteobacteria bacterium]|nr:hypothetical protein [Alphaproteobacteria bacterium]MDD9919619.1 hypothetical protein [Alphaproteobacteria bacterium]
MSNQTEKTFWVDYFNLGPQMVEALGDHAVSIPKEHCTEEVIEFMDDYNATPTKREKDIGQGVIHLQWIQKSSDLPAIRQKLPSLGFTEVEKDA